MHQRDSTALRTPFPAAVYHACTVVLARLVQPASWTSCAAVRPPRSAACRACRNFRVPLRCAVAAVFLDTGNCAGGCFDEWWRCCWAVAAALRQARRVSGCCTMLPWSRGWPAPQCLHPCPDAGTGCRTGLQLSLADALLLVGCCSLSTTPMDMPGGLGERYTLIGRRAGGWWQTGVTRMTGGCMGGSIRSCARASRACRASLRPCGRGRRWSGAALPSCGMVHRRHVASRSTRPSRGFTAYSLSTRSTSALPSRHASLPAPAARRRR